MRNIKIAALQFSCCSQVQENIDKAETMVREAASNGANLILLPELFERPYFCQEKRYDYYDYALPLTENPAVRRFQAVAGELGVVIPVSFYERDVQRLFNSIAMIDADGSILGVYRKTHIPDDHFYQEKFYFTPGDTGFKVFETRFGAVGVGICWDQWFPETARCKAANEVFGDSEKIKLIKPLEVVEFHNLLSRSYLILTDSGGIQEEAPSLGKPVIVLRDTTERPEGIDAGTLKLAGTEEETIYQMVDELLSDSMEYEKMMRCL